MVSHIIGIFLTCEAYPKTLKDNVAGLHEVLVVQGC